jgi:cytochrome c oxidase cbb3-type subunit I
VNETVATMAERPLKPTEIGIATEQRALLSDIDRSCRWPVLFLFANALLWLMAGTVLAIISSIRMHAPGFLANWAWLTFGRVRPAHLNTEVYGFASQAAIGMAIWLMCRLSRVPLMQGWQVILGTIFWNIGVTVGVWGILAGDSTGIEWLEMPAYATPMLFVSYALVAIWAVMTFGLRRERHLYVSQWYLLAALFWFPWLYSAASMLLVLQPARGTVQAAVNWWFAHNVLGLWFTPIGLAAIYYLIPKVIGRPIHSYYLSILGFWSLALFYNWNGIHHLVGGPMPAWLISISIVASVMMIIPVVTVAINHHMTMVGHFRRLKHSPTLRFIVFGAMCYTAVSLQGSSMALRSVSEIAHFTHHTIAHAHLGMYAFFTMVAFGSMYYIVPRLTLREWPSARLIYLHFWTAALGIMLYVIPLLVGGVLQGLAMNNPDIPFLKTVELTKPFLVNRSAAGLIITVGHVAFVANFIWILVRHFGPYREPSLRLLTTERPALAALATSTSVRDFEV